MAEVLDNSLELVVSEQIGGVSGGVQSLVQLGSEGLDHKSHFKVGVGSEHLGGVDSAHLERPVVDDDYLVVEVHDVHLGELLVELGDGLLGEVRGNEEETIGHEEVRVSFLDVALEGALEILGELAEVTALVDEFGEELLESGLLSLGFGHDRVREKN